MIAFYTTVFSVMWLAWVAYWWWSSRRVKVTARSESVSSRFSYFLPQLLAGILLFADLPVLGQRFLPIDSWRMWGAVGVALNLAGLLFTVWARVHLGKNWSDIVTLKQDHQLVTSGPYSIVRHPIYTGLLLAFAGLAVARGEWRSILGLVIMALSFWLKLRMEERFMVEQFGNVYESYRQRVTALVPFVI